MTRFNPPAPDQTTTNMAVVLEGMARHIREGTFKLSEFDVKSNLENGALQYSLTLKGEVKP